MPLMQAKSRGSSDALRRHASSGCVGGYRIISSLDSIAPAAASRAELRPLTRPARRDGTQELAQVAAKASGSKNIRFDEFVALVEAFGFALSRTSGSHHIFQHPDVDELLNLQNSKGKAKPYQIKQFLELVELYNLELGET